MSECASECECGQQVLWPNLVLAGNGVPAGLVFFDVSLSIRPCRSSAHHTKPRTPLSLNLGPLHCAYYLPLILGPNHLAPLLTCRTLPLCPPPTNPCLFWSRFQPPLLLFLSPTLPPWSSRVCMRHYLSNSAAAAAGPLRPRSLKLCCVSSAALEVGSNIFTRQFSSIDGREGLQKNLQQNLQQKKSLRS